MFTFPEKEHNFKDIFSKNNFQNTWRYASENTPVVSSAYPHRAYTPMRQAKPNSVCIML